MILIAQEERRVTVVRRTESGWLRSIHLDEIEIEIEQTGKVAVESFYP